MLISQAEIAQSTSTINDLVKQTAPPKGGHKNRKSKANPELPSNWLARFPAQWQNFVKKATKHGVDVSLLAPGMSKRNANTSSLHGSIIHWRIELHFINLIPPVKLIQSHWNEEKTLNEFLDDALSIRLENANIRSQLKPYMKHNRSNWLFLLRKEFISASTPQYYVIAPEKSLSENFHAMFGAFGGQTAAQPASTGFSFGAPAAGAVPASTPSTGSSGFSFGGSTPSFGGFGATSNPSSQATTANSSTFSFGSAAPSSTPSSSGFSFGSTPSTTPASSGFSFGGNTSTPAASTTPSTGFSFGGASTTPSTAPTTSFPFGNTTTAPATGGFGAPAAGTSTFSFGNNAAKPSMFGGFGATTPAQQPASGLFQLGAATSNAFQPNNSTTNALAAATSAAANSPMESLTGIRMAYMDPQQSRFKHMFYNAVDPAQKHLYVRPAHISEKLWTQAQRDNPDPANCVPAPVIGFKELSTRIKLQQEHADKFATYADDMVTQVKEMEKSSRETDVKLAQCRHQHVALFHRLIKLMRKLEVFKNLRKPLHQDEVRLFATLKKIASLLDNPTQFKARMNELMALQAMLKDKPMDEADEGKLSDHDLQLVFGIMNRQRQGLEHVTKVLTQDLRDVEIMQKALADDC
ncbi:carbohydrate-binding protein [Thraustotheca clavata]|uniref:Carbohydrate-binding protein n=1 Tax=Thraustotheca clavata TaxID=74557 RepID=A0A1V9ZK41_9STRA|nr:carbohydrate-binding protein [Thraustotheca clavata]